MFSYHLYSPIQIHWLNYISFLSILISKQTKRDSLSDQYYLLIILLNISSINLIIYQSNGISKIFPLLFLKDNYIKHNFAFKQKLAPIISMSAFCLINFLSSINTNRVFLKNHLITKIIPHKKILQWKKIVRDFEIAVKNLKDIISNSAFL